MDRIHRPPEFIHSGPVSDDSLKIIRRTRSQLIKRKHLNPLRHRPQKIHSTFFSSARDRQLAKNAINAQV